MAIVHVIKLRQPMQFEQAELPAGCEIGTVCIEQEAVRLSQLLSLVQYGHVDIELIPIETDEEELPLPDEAPNDSGSGDGDESNQGGNTGDEDESGEGDNTGGDNTDGDESNVGSLAKAGFDEALIEALAANEITELDQLVDFIKSGKDLVDLDRIGKVRAEKILALTTQFLN